MQLPEGSPLRSRFIHRIFPSTSFLDGLRIVSEGEKTVLDIVELASCFQHLHPKIIILREEVCLIAAYALNGAPSIHGYGMIDRAAMLAILIDVLRFFGQSALRVNMIGSINELVDPCGDKIVFRVLSEDIQLSLEAVRVIDIVGVGPGNNVMLTIFHSFIERYP